MQTIVLNVHTPQGDTRLVYVDDEAGAAAAQQYWLTRGAEVQLDQLTETDETWHQADGDRAAAVASPHPESRGNRAVAWGRTRGQLPAATTNCEAAMKTVTSILTLVAFDTTDQALADEKQLLSMVEVILGEDERSAGVTSDDDAETFLPAERS